ncbi:HD domain-containing phosphohydrolase [Methylophilus sp. DW102]|uniref:HD-GYP domain-containing protein n=1 Tax=Methylophilus sp. DW102 TaxID=3095607 RepID=UPI00308E5675|nr:HD domain-containing protein [Methylophilus sp. DW102]
MSEPASKHSGVLHLSKVFADALRLRDAYTRLHSDRVMALSRGIGLDIGLTSQELDALELGACLHDIGKIVVPDAVLMKPTRLDADDRAIMQVHPEVGANLIAAYAHNEANKVAQVVRHHHEWFDGSGYPDRLAGEAFPLLSRIVTVVDNYDAMAVRRVYQEARPHDEILRIMESESGSKLDPDLFQRFVKVIHDPRYAEFKAS